VNESEIDDGSTAVVCSDRNGVGVVAEQWVWKGTEVAAGW
jgi:hypothetical protein